MAGVGHEKVASQVVEAGEVVEVGHEKVASQVVEAGEEVEVGHEKEASQVVEAGEVAGVVAGAVQVKQHLAQLVKLGKLGEGLGQQEFCTQVKLTEESGKAVMVDKEVVEDTAYIFLNRGLTVVCK